MDCTRKAGKIQKTGREDIVVDKITKAYYNSNTMESRGKKP
jgi:hypothetical protein